MFAPSPGARLYIQPVGTDFPRAVVEGLYQRLASKPPEAIARVTLIVNTTRMQRRLTELFSERSCGFLPRIIVLSHICDLLGADRPPPARHSLRRALELTELLKPLVENRPEFAVRSSVLSLAQSLAALMDEMQGEDVHINDLKALDIHDLSGHWQNAKLLIEVAHDYANHSAGAVDPEARQRVVTRALEEKWRENEPRDPIILAGSTGSRGTTFELMKLISSLAQGAVILPGVDRFLPDTVWDRLAADGSAQDHAQYRIAKVFKSLSRTASQIEPWHAAPMVSANRHEVISMALRPAPVTDTWLTDGPSLPDLEESLDEVTLLEAPTPRTEALCIAMKMRAALEAGQKIALITPDRNLTRQVTACLDRWGILPDDSAGTPCALSPPGRFLRHVAAWLYQPPNPQTLIEILKHPLCQSSEREPNHGLFTFRLEAFLRNEQLVELSPTSFDGLDPDRFTTGWVDWLRKIVEISGTDGQADLRHWTARIRQAAEYIAEGDSDGSGGLWKFNAGAKAQEAFQTIEEHADDNGLFTGFDVETILMAALSQFDVRDSDAPHPLAMIWGTLEARVQGADIVILSGLNEGTWPEATPVDPWLNRTMRSKLNLLLPEREIGLAAHDFQQAVAAPEVWITRSKRSADVDTIPSRWINRLVNLLSGLLQIRGDRALATMKQRGSVWIDKAQLLEDSQPTPPAPRPGPCVPVAHRPRDFSVTEIQTLIRDPYAIYAKHCLRLRPWNTLMAEPDALVRGIVIHEIMEQFITHLTDINGQPDTGAFMKIVDDVLKARVPWALQRLTWKLKMGRITDWVVASEERRLSVGRPFALEKTARGRLQLPEIGSSIRARADRIDITPDEQAIIYDYKTGAPPSAREQKMFDRQLLIEAALVESGAFDKIGTRPSKKAVYIGLGPKPSEVETPLDKTTSADTIADLKQLLRAYLEPDQPYLPRRILKYDDEIGNYDHLARFGEWKDGDTALIDYLEP